MSTRSPISSQFSATVPDAYAAMIAAETWQDAILPSVRDTVSGEFCESEEKEEDCSSTSSNEEGGGNTKTPPTEEASKKQVSAQRHWCFTWNNYPSNWKELLFQGPDLSAYVFGKEVGDQGTPHIQGYLCFAVKNRPKNFYPKGIHWEKCKKIQASIIYCRKDGDYIEKGVPAALRVLTAEQLRPWQARVVELVVEPPDDRTVHWFWESVGNVGKSALCKHLVHHHNALICAGKASDMKFLVAKFIEREGFPPDLLIMDIPRSSLDYVSYTGLEEVKNGLFASTKYECAMVCMNSPHLIIFANSPPELSNTMSADRWHVVDLNNEPRGR